MSAAGEAKRNAERIVGGQANQLMRALAMKGLDRLIEKTPVDTGRARANWNVSVGAPDTSTRESATSSAVDAKKAEGVSRIGSVNFPAGDELFITNGLDYIKALEDGHSQQAANGMVAVTVEELKPLADQIAREVAK